jgi:hypothetical protein
MLVSGATELTKLTTLYEIPSAMFILRRFGALLRTFTPTTGILNYSRYSCVALLNY